AAVELGGADVDQRHQPGAQTRRRGVLLQGQHRLVHTRVDPGDIDALRRGGGDLGSVGWGGGHGWVPLRVRTIAGGHRSPSTVRPTHGRARQSNSTSASKQVSVPVWQAGPVWSTVNSTASPSQSSWTRCTCWVLPDSSPLTHIRPREREK